MLLRFWDHAWGCLPSSSTYILKLPIVWGYMVNSHLLLLTDLMCEYCRLVPAWRHVCMSGRNMSRSMTVTRPGSRRQKPTSKTYNSSLHWHRRSSRQIKSEWVDCIHCLSRCAVRHQANKMILPYSMLDEGCFVFISYMLIVLFHFKLK